jgi:release factor glutamine methyltransferase
MNDTERLLQEKYNGQKTEAWLADCARLEAGEPLAYLIGHVPFLDCTIFLDSQPLIPRPETEFWTEHAIRAIQNGSQTFHSNERFGDACSLLIRVLDVCAGSGCVGVAVQKAIPEARVDFAEIELGHHPTIIKNWNRNILENPNTSIYGSVNPNVFGGDLFSEVPDEAKYDFILSNPPYIDPALDRTETSVKDFEPHQALYGGVAGIELIAEIIATAPRHLKPHGQLWLEHEPEQSKQIQELAKKAGFTVTTHHDQYQVERYSVLVLQ